MCGPPFAMGVVVCVYVFGFAGRPQYGRWPVNAWPSKYPKLNAFSFSYFQCVATHVGTEFNSCCHGSFQEYLGIMALNKDCVKSGGVLGGILYGE